ncbi:MAG: hypothetical protein IJ613_00565 [Muribaculaceae bacterium]|nr:hypothetical protein [Muribaculaceae bacterium]
MKIRYILLAACVAIVQHHLQGQTIGFQPVLHNYGKADYQAALQNWDITQGSNGEVYVGNGAGVLRYDGYFWSLTTLPGNAVARSLLATRQRVYVGTYQDFGFLEQDELGRLQYTSLWPHGYKPHEDEIWNIVRDKRGVVYFQSFAGWFSYDGKRVKTHFDPHKLPLYFHEVDGVVYVQMQEGDFYRLDGERLTRLFGRDQVANDHIVALTAAPGGGLMLYSQSHGLYRWHKGEVGKWANESDSQLMAANINRATLVPGDSTLVVGTILGGVYAIDRHGKARWHYDMGSHLANNCVLGLMCDCQGNVWVAMDTGLAHIACSSPYTLLTPGNDRPSLGMVYGLCVTDNHLYIATNQAAWRFTPADGQCRRIGGSEGQNWHVTEMDGMLLLGNNSGTKRIDPVGLTAQRINDRQQSSTCMRRCTINGKEVLLESSYYNMRVYARDPGGTWTYQHEIDGLHAPIAEFEVDPSGVIWASHMSRGLFSITLSPDMRRAQVTRYDRIGSDTTMALTHVMKMRGRIVIQHNHRLYTYDDIKRQIVPYTELDSILDDADIDAATAVDDNSLWLASRNGFKYVRYDNGAYRLVRSVTPQFFGLDCNDTKNKVYVHDGVAYFNLNNGVGCYDMSRNAPVDTAHHELRMQRVLTHGRGDAEHLMPLTTEGSVPQALPQVDIELSYPNFNHEPLTFEFALTGGGVNLRSASEQPTVEYSSLGYGSYTFVATVKALDGTVIDTVEYHFVRPRPFYASWWAWLVYAATLAAAVYALVRYRTRKTAQQMRRQYEDQRLQQDFRVLEQEKIIVEQKQQLLEAQLNDKAREAASLALDAAARNQAIEGLRETLRQKRRKGSISQTDMAAMLGQLGDSADSDNFWEVYQNNFNLIHQNFFKRLKEQYPTLTPTDLRFCALLRLNLSTKDIAQFTGLSVRGVEGARYRLRKKLDLPEGANLIDFLIDFE